MHLSAIEGLTERQRQMAALVMQGLSNKQIGRQLKISHNTVRETLHKVFDRLGISSRVQLALWASARVGEHDYDPYDR